MKKTLKVAAVCAALASMFVPAFAGAGNQFISIQEEPVWNEEFNRWCILRTTEQWDPETSVYRLETELICL